MSKEKFSVSGMTCAACSAHVEKAVRNVAGVQEVSVSLLTNSMQVDFAAPATEQEICAAVAAAGYGAQPEHSAQSPGAGQGAATLSSRAAALEDQETPRLARRLVISLCLLLPLMYVSMGHGMWGWPLPAALAGNALALGLCQLLLSALVMLVNQRFFISGFQSLLHGGPNMDTLVAMGSGAAFVYSVAELFLMCFAVQESGIQAANHYLHNFYFESAAMILTLITVGKLLEARSKGKTTNAIKSLMDLAPKTAHVLRDGQEVLVPAEQVRVGEVFVVRPGESIPVDGEVLEGESAVNEAALTGESLPVDKAPGQLVSAATLNQNGFLTCRATRVGADTTLSQIIDMVENAAASKAPIAKVADRVSAIFVPTVIGIALLTCIVWLAVGQSFGFALARAISVLVISCPCALGLATPVAIMVGSGVGAKNGVLFKTAAALEATGRVQFVVLDKTGTITQGQPQVTDIVPAPGVSQEQLLAVAAALEQKSEHPLARAIQQWAAQQGLQAVAAEDFSALPGHGVQGQVEGRAAMGGNASLMQEQGLLDADMQQTGQQLASAGKTPLYFALDGRLLGIVAVADVVKPDSAQAVAQLKQMGVQPVMLTGDNRRTAQAIAAQVGVQAVVADVLPQDKEAVIRRIADYGKVAMVGDGINDAPALTRADVGIAIGAGADVALDAADIVLMKSSLLDVAAAIRLSRQVLRNIHQNLFWAFFYNCIGIPIAAGLLIPGLGIQLSPMLGAAAMSLSSFCVVSNALRLNLFSMYNAQRDSGRKQLPLPDFLRGDSAPEAGASCPAVAPATACQVAGASCQKAEQGLGSARIENGEKVENRQNSASLEKPENMEKSEKAESLQNKEENFMKKTIYVEGMSCAHCQMHVQKALLGVAGVHDAEVSLEENKAVVTLDQDVPDQALMDAVTDAGYTPLRCTAQ